MQIAPDLDPRSDAPLYRQLRNYIADLVRAGKLARGDRLPATRELAGSLGLNRATVAAAYELLESEGLVASHVGRGSFIAGAPDARHSLDWTALVGSPLVSLPPPALDGGISFAASRPGEDLFPLDDVRATSVEEHSPSGTFPLSSSWVRRRVRAAAAVAAGRGARARRGRSGRRILITNGCQQALDLIGRVLLRPGDTVAVEDPVYPGLKNLLHGHGRAAVRESRAAQTAWTWTQLERVLERERPRFLVVTSNFQNPTGATLPLAARRELLRMRARMRRACR